MKHETSENISIHSVHCMCHFSELCSCLPFLFLLVLCWYLATTICKLHFGQLLRHHVSTFSCLTLARSSLFHARSLIALSHSLFSTSSVLIFILLIHKTQNNKQHISFISCIHSRAFCAMFYGTFVELAVVLFHLHCFSVCATKLETVSPFLSVNTVYFSSGHLKLHHVCYSCRFYDSEWRAVSREHSGGVIIG